MTPEEGIKRLQMDLCLSLLKRGFQFPNWTLSNSHSEFAQKKESASHQFPNWTLSNSHSEFAQKKESASRISFQIGLHQTRTLNLLRR